MRIRIPLQVGTSAVHAMAIGVLIFPGACIGAIGMAFPPLLLLAVPLVAVGGAVLPWLFRRRPSDVEVDRDGLTFVGGRTDGFLGGRLSWGDVDVGEWQFTSEVKNRFGPQAFLPTTSLLANDGNDALVLAETSSDDEEASLRDLVRTLEAMTSEVEPPLADEIVRCTFCGAPATPDDAPVVRCGSCKAEVAMPKEVRERIAAQRELKSAARAEERALRALLAQPSARTANALLFVVATVLYAVWIAAVPLVFEMWAWRALNADVAPWLAVFPVGLLVCGWAIGMGIVQRRYALRGVLLGYGAAAPAEAGAPHACRACSAPLPAAADGLVTRCAYCNAENVLGLDLRHKARTAPPESSLRRDLATYRFARAFWGSLAILAVVTTGWLTRGFVTHVADAFHHAPPVPRDRALP